MIEVSDFKNQKGLIPDAPGVYKYRDKSNVVIYVGKAKNLKKRLSSYFISPNRLDGKTKKMLENAKTLEWTIVSSEIEALTLEYSYIQKFHPKYNILYRDDKSYPYLAIDYNEKYPRVFITRRKRRANIKYFGPFTQIWAIRKTLNDLTDIFPLRTCTKGVFQGAKMSNRPCLLGFIGKCSSPCTNSISETDYKTILDDFSQFLYGKTHGIKGQLKQKMRETAKEQKYEEANIYKKKLEAIDIVLEKNSAQVSDSLTADFFAISSDELDACIYAFFVSGGFIVGEQKWLITKNLIDDNARILENVLFDLYGADKRIPSKIFINVDFESSALQDYLAGVAEKKVEVKTPKKGKTASLIDKALNNAKTSLETSKLSRLADIESRTKSLDELQKALNMDTAPLRAECYDISHTNAKYRTGSMVVFIDGVPKKSEYRQFNIRNNNEGEKDDTHAIYEVISRRLENISKNSDKSLGSKPDLIVIDGGVGQVNAAESALQNSQIQNIALCSLAKRLEEIYMPGKDKPIIMSRTSPALYLLQYLRDESHRFAISRHRNRREKALLENKSSRKKSKQENHE
ncbi:MAG: excinuclease ABC subunit UvrC [Bifidobacteriaceae bacterium]|nr:excinuclease ABC subunit UvrC [Bifidobacteriaceae bacterium]